MKPAIPPCHVDANCLQTYAAQAQYRQFTERTALNALILLCAKKKDDVSTNSVTDFPHLLRTTQPD